MADGIMNKDQLLLLTLRQLRQEASKLSVPLYSRKTKAVLVDLILKYQEKLGNIQYPMVALYWDRSMPIICHFYKFI